MVSTRSATRAKIESLAGLSRQMNGLELEGNIKRPAPGNDNIESNKLIKITDKGELAYQLNTQGYVLVENLLSLDKIEKIKTVFGEVKSNVNITQAAKTGARGTMTTNRQQKFLRDNEKLESVKNLLEPVFEMLHSKFDYKREMIGTGLEGVTLLLNGPGVPEQNPHTDYGNSIDQTAAKVGIQGTSEAHLSLPAIAIVTLDDNTPFNVWPGHINHQIQGEEKCGNVKILYSYDIFDEEKKREIIPSAGSVLLFRGDLVHSGAYNDKPNQRLHVSVNKNVTSGTFTNRNASARPTDGKNATTIDRVTGQDKARFQQCTRLKPQVKHYAGPNSVEKVLTPVDDLAGKKIVRTWANEEKTVSVVFEQTPSKPVFLSSSTAPEGQNILEISVSCDDSLSEVLLGTGYVQNKMTLSQNFTLFGPNTMQNCTLFVRLEGDEDELTELSFLI